MKLLKLSINKHLIDKIPPSDPKFFAEGFEPYEFTISEIAEVIGIGCAISYRFKGGVRSSKNFQCSDFLAIDIDGGWTLSDCLAHDTVKRFASLVYTTPSHSVDEHRFRILFALPRTITDAKELRFATKALARRLGGDPSATDAARMYYGSSDGFKKQLGGELSEEFLSKLIEEGRLKHQTDSPNPAFPTTNSSNRILDPDEKVTTAKGDIVSLSEIQKKTSIYCPFHRDSKPSAFVARNKKGVYIHCSSCRETWTDANYRRDSYNFLEFDETLHKIHSGEITTSKRLPVGLEKFFDHSSIAVQNLLICNDQYLDINSLKLWDSSEGITFIKSPKGSGKTTYLANLVGRLKYKFATLEEYEENDDPDAPEEFYSNKSILLIGHRQALIGELCQRLGLNCYLDHPTTSGVTRLEPVMKRFGVCLDSLWRVEGRRYDTIVIDESEQVISHFLSDTISSSRFKLFRVFQELIGAARNVVVLDADLGWTSFNTLVNAKRHPGYQSTLSAPDVDETVIRIVLNEWTENDKRLLLFENEKHLIGELKIAVMAGKRVFVTSNSKKKIEALSSAIAQLGRKIGSEIDSIAITSSNSKRGDVQEFIRNIKEKVLDYQVILCSPSLGTGIDISFENDTQHIDCVFGLFEPRITSHFEIDQQIGRVRNPKETKVWINPRCFNFETEFEIVLDDIKQSKLADSLEPNSLGSVDQAPDRFTDFLKMTALVTRNSRASKNRLKENFIEHKRHQGFEIEFVRKDESQSELGSELYRTGSQSVDLERKTRLLGAKTLNEVEFRKLQNLIRQGSDTVTELERDAFTKTFLELFYRQKLTEQMLNEDGAGALRRQIMLLEALQRVISGEIDPVASLPRRDERALVSLHIELIPDRHVAAGLISELLRSTPLLQDGKLQPEAVYSASDLKLFVEVSLKLKRFVEGQLQITTRADVAEKPMHHLGKILSTLGLTHTNVRSQNADGRKLRFYQLQQKRYEFLTDLIQTRNSVPGWQRLNELYEFEYTSEQVDWLLEQTPY